MNRRARKTRIPELDYGPAAGSQALRDAICAHLRRSRAVACDPSQVIVVTGSQQALDLIARVLIDPGDGVVIEDPGSPDPWSRPSPRPSGSAIGIRPRSSRKRSRSSSGPTCTSDTCAACVAGTPPAGVCSTPFRTTWVSEEAVVTAAASRGVGIYGIGRYFLKRPSGPGIMLGYPRLREADIREGVRRLADIL